MPYFGSVSSAVSTMLSCLSPLIPCCCPNAAVTLIPAAISASRLCTRSSVTEAGCATSATRLPSRGLRSADSASRRSIPNFIAQEPSNARCRKRHREASGRVEIGLALGMRERPVRLHSALLLENCTQPHRAVDLRQPGDRDRRVENRKAAALAQRAFGLVRERPLAHPCAVTVEIVHVPALGGRQVELAVRLAAQGLEVKLEAGGLPQLVGPAL